MCKTYMIIDQNGSTIKKNFVDVVKSDIVHRGTPTPEIQSHSVI